MFLDHRGRSSCQIRSLCQNSAQKPLQSFSKRQSIFMLMLAQLMVNRKGVADDILAKREAERERSRKHDRDEESLERNADSSKRRRSLSSSVSVSTISTRSSSPRSPPRKAANDADRGRISGDQRVKRARSRSSSEYSYRSTSRTGSRSNRRRYSRDSPRPRGRGRSRSREPYRAENGRDMVTKGDGARDARDTRRNLDISSTDARRELSMARERPKERSLSPFSKRLALTRSMNN